MAKAYSYIRFSKPEQASGDSLRRQLELSKAYAAEHGLELDTTLKMTDLGVSAFRGKNLTEGALGDFFHAVEIGTVPPGSYLLVESLDRLSRDEITVALTSFMQIINAGIVVVTLSDKIVYSRESLNANMGSLMMSLVIMARAHEESATKSKRILASWESKRASLDKKKMTAVCPQWLRLAEDKKTFLEIPERIDVIRKIFDLRCAGYGTRRIAQALNLDKTPTWRRGKVVAKGWHTGYVTRILESRAVLGEFQPRRTANGVKVPAGDPIPNYFPAVITLAQWNRANAGRRRTGGRTTRMITNLFAGIAFEGGTDFKMQYVDKGNGTKCTRYLRSDRSRLEPNVVIPTWNYDETEDAFLRVMADLDWPAIMGHAKTDEAGTLMEKIAAQEREYTELELKITRLTEAIATSTQELPPLVKTLETATGEAATLYRLIKENKDALRRLEAQHDSFSRNIEGFREIIKKAGDATDIEFRLRLREEIRNKVKRIEFNHSGWKRWQQIKHPWLNPNSMLIIFQNGAARIVLIQPGKPGQPVEIKMANAAAP